MGWTPAALAGFTGANTDGVRNPYAVLGSRLSPAELPLPAGQRLVRPPWCDTCDERTRRRQDAEGDDSGRCPACPTRWPAICAQQGHRRWLEPAPSAGRPCRPMLAATAAIHLANV